MFDDDEIVLTPPRFSLGQRVRTSDDRQGYICGLLFYPDERQWHYALYVQREGLDCTWYTDSEITSPVESWGSEETG